MFIRSFINSYVLVTALLITGCVGNVREMEAEMQEKNVVRVARGSGRWFPGEEDKLRSMVSECIDGAPAHDVSGQIVAAIAPHAGYVYSGKVAGHVFRTIKDNLKGENAPETVVVLGFSHRSSFSGVAIMDGDMLSTPLGEATLDVESSKLLCGESDSIFFDYAPHDGEHSAENEIPFIQEALGDSKLIVAIIGDHDAKTVAALVAALTKLAEKKKILVVASTDMLHHADYDLVTKTDKETLEKIKKLDYESIVRSWSYSNQICCGIMPVLTAMQFARTQGASEGTLLHYRNSGDDFPEGRGSWVVGYGAVVFSVER